MDPTESLLVGRISGRGEGAFQSPIVSTFEASLEKSALVRLFFDLEQMKYDSALRTGLTARIIKARQRVGNLHVRMHRARASFMETLMAELTRRTFPNSFGDPEHAQRGE